MKKDLIKTYPFEHFKKQMPKEIQNLITPESRTDANEFEEITDAVLYGLIWGKTKNKTKICEYYESIY